MNWFRILFACTFLVAFVFAAPTPSLAQQKAPWSYEGETGPENWAELSTDYAVCNGDQQSPIDLRRTERQKNPTLKISYGSGRATVVNRNRATQVNTTLGEMILGSRTYELQQLHVHTPAEHTIRDNRRAAEIHLVHSRARGTEIAVIALMVRQGEENPALSPLVQGVQKGQKRTINNYNVRSLFPEDWRSS